MPESQKYMHATFLSDMVSHFLKQSGPPSRTDSISHGGWSTFLIPYVFSYWG